MLRLIFVTLAVIALTACSRTDGPNVLIMMADDLGRNDLGFYGNTEVSTPHIDALFQRGVALDRLYVDSSCKPTRSALMTGLDPTRLGYAPVGYGLSPDVSTLPKMLAMHGYRTSHIGKWHIGYVDKRARPNGAGFEYFYGFLDQGFLRGPQQEPPQYHRPPTYRDPWMQENTNPPTQIKGHLQDIITNTAVQRIKSASRGSPWFINVWFYAPHEPVEPAQRYLGESPSPKDKYLASLRQLDDNVGAILEALETSGQAENTLILFLSDNGGTNRYYDNNFPLTGGKGSFTEGGIRTPGVMVGPMLGESPRMYTHVIQHTDIVPTVLEAASIKSDRVFDGQSHWKGLTGHQAPPSREHFWHRESSFGDEFGVLSRDGRWLLSRTFFSDTALWLQDLSSPTTARHNAVADPGGAEIVSELLHALKTWRNDRATLRLQPHRVDPDSIELSGQDFLRTPGTGQSTYGFALQGNWHDGHHQIASQSGIWSLEINDGVIEYRWQDIFLTGSAPEQGTCNSIMISTSVELPGILQDSSKILATLYINGSIAAQQRLENKTQIPTKFPPTRINMREKPEAGMPTVAAWTARSDMLFNNEVEFDTQVRHVAESLCKTQ